MFLREHYITALTAAFIMVLVNSGFDILAELVGKGTILSLWFGILSSFMLIFAIVLQVGSFRFYIRGIEGNVDIDNLWSTFNKQEFWPIIKAQLLVAVRIFLWSLLFVIPGLVKAYQYRFVTAIMAENPGMYSSDALRESSKLTKGIKIDLLLLDLSFMGWIMAPFILVAFTSLISQDLYEALLALGGLILAFVSPYLLSTEAYLYKELTGKIDFQENFNKLK